MQSKTNVHIVHVQKCLTAFSVRHLYPKVSNILHYQSSELWQTFKIAVYFYNVVIV